jgi:5'-nucleotidase (lipoprotein e(P4) family)
MRYLVFFSLSGLLALAPAAHAQKQSVATVGAQTRAEARVPSQEYLMGATLFTQQAAEYRALCYQAYNLAEWRLREALRGKPAKPAIIIDLDETVLDNSAYTAWQIAADQPYKPETWRVWVERAAAPAVPGAVPFLRLADSLEVTIFYVSNRSEEEYEATRINMEILGLPQLSPEHFLLRSTTSDKSDRRRTIYSQGYEVLLLIGDNLGDFDGYWEKLPNAQRKESAEKIRSQFGNRYIVLPNALYGNWEGAIYQYDWSLDMRSRDQLRREALQPAEME